MQLHGVTLSFHRQVYDASREFVWPNVVMAVSSESYPRFIKSCFHDHEGLGIKRAIAKAVHVSLPAIEPPVRPHTCTFVRIAQLHRATPEKQPRTRCGRHDDWFRRARSLPRRARRQLAASCEG